MCYPLVGHIVQGHSSYPPAIVNEQLTAKTMKNCNRHQQQKQMALSLQSSLLPVLQHAMTLAQERGASSWVTTLPISEFGFALHKSAFRNALTLRYGWQPLNVPTTCSCGKSFTLDYVLSCAKGGFPSIQPMKFVMSQPPCCLKCATMLPLSLIYSHLMVKFFPTNQLMQRMEQGWTL